MRTGGSCCRSGGEAGAIRCDFMRGPFHGITLCALSHPGPAAAGRAWRVGASCVSNACTQSGSICSDTLRRTGREMRCAK
eukprot:4246803-Prymnesium_polylepis.1